MPPRPAPPVYRPVLQLKPAPPVYRPQLRPQLSPVSAVSPAHRSVNPITQVSPPLPVRTVQRFAVALHNLTTVSTTDYNPHTETGGKSDRVVGSKVAHSRHALTIAGTAATYNVDEWTNRKSKADTSGRISAEDIGLGTHIFDRSARRKIRKLVAKWDCKDTIIDPILKNHVFSADPATAKWWDPGADAGATVTLQVKDTLSGAQSLVAHLITLRATLYWRWKTIKALSIEQVRVKYGTPSTEENVTLKWAELLEAGRKIVKQKLLAGTAPPFAPPSEADSGGSMNTEIYTAFDTAGGFNKLKEKQIFYQPHGSGYQIHTDGKNCLLEDRRNGIVAGSNHIRFILWQEWRAVHELL